MQFTAEDVKRLREATGAGFADCSAALTDSASYEQAVKVIEEKGQKRADKVKGQDRETRQGYIGHYIHHAGNLGVLVELNCSTDFVARNEEFRQLAKDLAMQVAGLNPKYISFSEIPEAELEAYRKELANDPEVKKRPVDKRPMIIEGKLKKQLGSQILLEQTFVKDDTKTIGAMVDDLIRKTGENIVVRRFVRFALGE